MTRPHKINGISAKVLETISEHQRHAEETCRRKQRHPDEFVARAVGMSVMQQDPGTQRYIHKCRWCRGWHLTRQEQPPYYAADYFEKEK